MASILFQFLIKAFMKNSLKTKSSSILLGAILLIFSVACVKKNPGPGGKASIKGVITGQNFSAGELEKQQITFTNGAQLEHGDYFLLNQVKDGNNYYIYFKNPNWVTTADPNLQGRTGLEVVFNYSDSNIGIAQAVKSKLASIGVLDFNMTLTNDILTLTYKSRKDIPDPDNGTTNFAIDIANQGSADYLSPTILYMAEKHVYLCYGNNTIADEDVKTNNFGEFEFSNLQAGTYKVYTISDNPPYLDEHKEVSKTIEITESNPNTDAGTLQIYY
jgi:hypothetical protein